MESKKSVAGTLAFFMFALAAPVYSAADSSSRPAPVPKEESGGPGYFATHRTLGTVALGGFAGALAISAASGNLGRLMDEAQCCPDGGNRAEPWRTVDRVLVNVGIVAYLGAGGLAVYNMGWRNPDQPRPRHKAHRWLALAHGAAFATSMVTGILMAQSQESDPERFAASARVHVTANLLLVPLLTLAYGNILFE